MKKLCFCLIVIFATVFCNSSYSFTVEMDPATPLTDYISMAEWNTNGDFEDWTYNAHIDNAQVIDGNFEADSINVDPTMSLNISALTPPDDRMELATTVGTIFELRIQFITNTQNGRIDFFPTINGAGPGSFPPLQFAAGDVPTDGQFHTFRLTLEASDDYIGNLDALRLDPIADLSSTEAFKIDYIRVAKTTNQVVIIKVDGDPIFNYTSIGEWNTDNDFENWIFMKLASSNVTGGILSGVPAATSPVDPYFYKSDAEGLPAPDLTKAPILEFRLKQSATYTSDIEIFFGTSDNPGMSGARRVAIAKSEVPTDGQFHVYQYNMTTHSDWNSELQLLRIDPYVGAGSAGQTFEIDYIRVGSKETPTINPTATQGDHADKVVVTWDENSIVNKYQVWRSLTNDSATAVTNSSELTTNIYEDTSITPDVDYYYWVKAYITNDWGDFGNSAMGFATASTGPNKPTNISPVDGEAILSFPLELVASDYSDEGGWPMEAVQWQLNDNTNFSFVKWDSGILFTNLTTIQPPSPKVSLTNFWRVRYKNTRTKWSEWSDETMFTFDVAKNTNSSFYFYDTFNTVGSGNVNNGFYRAGRQFGTVVPLNYTITGESEVGSETENPGQLLLGLSSGVSPNYSFTDYGNFKIEFDVVPHALDKTNNWISLCFGKSDQSDLFPVSSSGAGLVFFCHGGFQAFDGINLVGSGTGVENDVPLHIILTASTEGFDNDEVKYTAFANGIPMRVKISPFNSYMYIDEGGYDNNYISLYSYNSVSTNTSLFDNLKISKVETTTTVTNWLNDTDLLPMNPAKATHAVNINGPSVTINGVNFIGTGTNFGGHANGSPILQSNGWELIGSSDMVVFHSGQNVSNIITDTATRTLMEYFGYFGNAGAILLSGLTPNSTNEISIYSYGWEAAGAGRFVSFSSTSGGAITNIDQDTYGIGIGIIVRYTYVADKNGEATIVIAPARSAGWHLAGFYSEEVSAPSPQISAPNKLDFGEVVVGNQAKLQLEIMNVGADVVSGSITGIADPFQLTNTYSATASTADVINVTFSPTAEGDYSQTITLSGTGGNAEIELIGTGVPEPAMYLITYLAFLIYCFRRKK